MKNINQSQKIKMSDIAQAAGVSLATVGRVLHRNGYVSKENREKIERLISEMGYVPDQMARGLKNQRSRLIGHLVLFNPNMLFEKISMAVNQAAMEQGFQVLTMSAHHGLDDEEEQINELIGYNVAGVIITSNAFIEKRMIEKLTKKQIPVVMIERTIDLALVDCIQVNDLQGARMAVEHILAQGHTRIGFIGMNPFHEVEKLRFQGYCDALTATGLPVNMDWVCLMDHYSVHLGAEAAMQLLSLDNAPTAIFTTSDLFACGVLQVLYKQGKRVPEDLALVGFDDTLSAMLAPPITSVALDLEDIGEQAMKLLGARMKNPNLPAQVSTIDTVLINRYSVGNAG